MDSTRLREFIKKADYAGLSALLAQNPLLANEPIPLDDNPAKAHPLHRICDGVFNGIYRDQEAAEMARIFLKHGARIDGDVVHEMQDTPLTAAASLRADEVALLYIDRGANIHWRGCHGGTALHWAAWCGRDRVVERLIHAKAELDKRCIDFNATPLFWAMHGYRFGGEENRHQ
jgi:uncharacterized protein